MQKMAPGAAGLNALFSAIDCRVTSRGSRLGCREVGWPCILVRGVDKNERSYYILNMTKGQDTRERILGEALELASTVGIEGLSIGELAKATEMSKSGLFAHFNSKEELQLEVLRTGSDHFRETVISPALREARGEPRVRALFERWLAWETLRAGGCPFMAATFELDDRPGRLRDALEATQREWVGILTKAIVIAMEEGHFHPDIDADQLAYEIYGVFMAFHLYHRLLRDPDAHRRATDAFDYLLRSAK
jgi:AcrR family transcriptional regulator